MSNHRQSPRTRALFIAGGGLCLVVVAGLWGWARHQRGGDLDSLARSGNAADRLAAASQLAQRDSGAVRSQLIRMLDDADVAVAAQAAESLGVNPHPDGRAALERVLAERSRPGEVQAAAAATLGEFSGVDPAILIDVLQTREQPLVRAGAAKGLTRLRDVRSVPALSRALEDSDPRVRIWAITAIHKMGARRFPYDARRDPAEQKEVILRIRDYLRACGVKGIE